MRITYFAFFQLKSDLAQKAGSRVSLLSWVGLAVMGLQFGVMARLTWVEYSWDIMEPVTYFITYGTSMAMFAYFVVTRRVILILICQSLLTHLAKGNVSFCHHLASVVC